MDKITLGEKQIQEGKLFISELDKANLEIKAAFWLFNENDGSWKLQVSSSSDRLNIKKNILEPYRILADIMRSIPDLSLISTQDIVLIPLDHPLIKNIGSQIQTGPGISDMRFFNTLMNQFYIEGMHLYRMNIGIR
jgi:hypothetical protein